MFRHHLHKRTRWGASALAVAFVVSAAAPVHAATGRPLPDSDSAVEYRRETGLPAGVVIPAVGQTTVTRLADGSTVTTTAVSASCTESSTAGNPRRVWRNNRYEAEGKTSFYTSSGCEWPQYSVYGRLYRWACGWGGCNWQEKREDGPVDVHPGWTVTFTHWRACSNLNNATWRTIADGDAYVYGVGTDIPCQA